MRKPTALCGMCQVEAIDSAVSTIPMLPATINTTDPPMNSGVVRFSGNV